MSKSDTRRSVSKRILLGVLIALVLLYIVFLFITTNFLGNSNIVTETAYHAKAYDVVKTTGIAVRDEEYIKSSSSGILVYDAADGEKVNVDGVIATAYNNEEDVVALQQIDELDEQIAYLESLNSLTAAVNVGLDTVNSQIDEKLVAMIRTVNSRSFQKLPEADSDLITSILRKQVITGEQGSFDDAIAELTSRRDSLKASCGTPVGTVKSTSSGYFVSSVDGYEGVFDVNALDEVTYTDFESAEPKDIDHSAYIGKVIKGVNWYLLCPVTEDEATGISHTTAAVKVRMPYAMSEDIPARVVSVNRFADEDKSMVVLQCNYMNGAIAKLREESIEIVVNEYDGLKISKSALHDDVVTRSETDDNGKTTTETRTVQGVYVQHGSELVFKQVAILYSGDDYIICNPTPGSDALFNGTTVELYDQVVVEGGDLFNGKLIE